MKIYNEIVFDVDGNVVYEDSFEYSGDIYHCGTGTPSPATVDPTISPEDQAMIDQGYFKSGNQWVKGTLVDSGMSDPLQDLISFNGDPNASTFGGRGGTGAGTSAEDRAVDTHEAALPSVAELSNMGVNSFSGAVNWNAIAGGFQPLPQLAGTTKKLYQLSQFHGGINQKSSPRDISDMECQEASNVTFSSIGAIKLLGDCLNTNNSITVNGRAISARCLSGYGLFQFSVPADKSGNVGQDVVTLSADGLSIDAHDLSNGANEDDWITLNGSTDDATVAPIFYASGNGVYVGDANYTSTSNAPKAKVYVYREDINGTLNDFGGGNTNVVNGWIEGKPLIDSPDQGTDVSDVVGSYGSHADEGDAGSMSVSILPTGTGTWGPDGATDYYFFVSWLFDGGCETGLTSIGSDSLATQKLDFNVSIRHTNAAPLGGDKRIEGARIYFKKTGTNERFVLAEISLVDGVQGALDTSFTPWDTTDAPRYDLGAGGTPAHITFTNPPEIYTYNDKNGYYANEVYTKSPIATGTTPTAHKVLYKTAVIGQQGIAFIGNVKIREEHFPDAMWISVPGKPGVFPYHTANRFDSPSSDGSPIVALAAYQGKILQFKQNAMFAINASNIGQLFAEASFRNCGVYNPCQVFTTEFGVVFANKHGCFIYDGTKVISLTGGKFDQVKWGLSEASANGGAAAVPCVGYDPRSQSIIVLKNIGDDAANENTSTLGSGAWIYNMGSQSWSESDAMITNADGVRHTNFIITTAGYLSILRNNAETLFNYNHDKATDTGAQTITYWTKDLDFGLPSQTKKLFKVYITYKGDADQLTIAYGVNGETDYTNDLYHFSTVSVGGTTATTPLEDKDSGDGASHESWHTATLYPDSLTEAKGWKSISLYMNGEVGSTFEIQDIAIMYRLRPIK